MIVLSVYCQETYPKTIIVDGDTIVAITPNQARKINVTYVKLERSEVVIDSLNVQVNDYRKRSCDCDSLNFLLTEQRDLLQDKYKISERALDAAEVEIEKNNRKIKNLKLIRNISIGVSLTALVALILR